MNNRHSIILYLIMVGYVALAFVYSVVTPIFEASDELWHYPMVKYLADNGLQLPPQDPAHPAPWRQEGSQPPLYYLLSAILTAGIDTSDMESVRRQNPHADIGIVRPDVNANMIVHRADAEAFPWRGTTLAVHIIRMFSIALGLCTVLVTYRLTHEIFPEWPMVALGAAAFNAFLPMFLFISASVNNDNLSNLLGNLLTLLTVRLLKVGNRQQLTWRTYLVIGLVAGAGLLAKLNIGFLIPLVGLGFLIASIRLRDWRPLVVGGVVSGGLTIAIAGWWYLRNQQLYGDPTGLNMFLNMVGRRAVYANLPQLWSERNSFTQAYWGFFGGVNVPMPEWIYLIFNITGGVGLAGAILFIVFKLFKREWELERWLPTAVTILWPIITFVSYLRWTAETPASQGRLVFGALSAISMWMATGLAGWLPKRFQPLILVGASGYFAVVAALTPFVVIAPIYSPPENAVNSEREVTATWEVGNGEGRIALVEANVLESEVKPEEYAVVSLTWRIEKALTRNWSIFVHLITADGVIIGQRDIYPGQGLLATTDLAEGRAWNDNIAVWVPTTAYAPNRLNVQIGWYDLQTGERMNLADGTETLTIGEVQLRAREDELSIPNPIRVNFDNQIELVGYELTDLSPAAGETLELTLYWRAFKPITSDYKVFANILDPQTLTKYAASDGMPANWNAPTSTWIPGEIIEDRHLLTVDPNAPPGIYETEIGWYLQAPDGSFPRLQIVTPDGGMANNFLNLSRVRIQQAEATS